MTNYSARLRHVALIEGARPSRRPLINETIVILRAASRRGAMRRALELGRASEHEYLNTKGKRVRLVFAEILTLDALPRELDGAEIWSTLEPRTLSHSVSFDSRFRPAASKPFETAPSGRLVPRRPTRKGAA
jgi:hypothetical protein